MGTKSKHYFSSCKLARYQLILDNLILCCTILITNNIFCDKFNQITPKYLLDSLSIQAKHADNNPGLQYCHGIKFVLFFSGRQYF